MNIDELAYTFLKEPNEKYAVDLIVKLIQEKQLNTAILLCEYFDKVFQNSFFIKDQHALANFYCGNYEKSYDIYKDALNLKGLDESQTSHLKLSQHYSIDNISNRYNFYNEELVKKISNRQKSLLPKVTLSITTCKRFDLFEQTINSIINCFDIDMIDNWLCIDDNSSEEDREKMKKLYPFFNFHFKDVSQKGHCNSMNLIKRYVTDIFKTPYLLHLEDDWKFFEKRDYIKEAIEILESDDKIGQCLFNKNYAETSKDINIVGGLLRKTNSGLRYYVHEYVKTESEKEEWVKKYGNNTLSSNYWPHFSFRPSLIKTNIYNKIGNFNKDSNHFEMEYAYRYFNNNYISVFFENIYSLHIGRLTSERFDDTKPNAYKLNNEQQFEKSEDVQTIVEQEIIDKKYDLINLEKDINKLKVKSFVNVFDENIYKNFLQNSENIILNIEKYNNIDCKNIKLLSQQFQRIFDNNLNMSEYNVSKILTHIKLYIELLKSDDDIYCIFNDNIQFIKDFDQKFTSIMKELTNYNWDICYIGFRDEKNQKEKNNQNSDILPVIEKAENISLTELNGYIINKNGVIKLLEFINLNGVTSTIENILQNSKLNIFYCNPSIIFSEGSEISSEGNKVSEGSKKENLYVNIDIKIKEEVKYYTKKGKNIYHIGKFEKALSISKDVTLKNKPKVYFYSDDNEKNIKEIEKSIILPSYIIENNVIFMVPGGDNGRYFNRLKKNGDYDISDIFLCK